jgi:hypothetical protein
MLPSGWVRPSFCWVRMCCRRATLGSSLTGRDPVNTSPYAVNDGLVPRGLFVRHLVVFLPSFPVLVPLGEVRLHRTAPLRPRSVSSGRDGVNDAQSVGVRVTHLLLCPDSSSVRCSLCLA